MRRRGELTQHVLRFAPWIASIVLGLVGTSRPANTTPPPQERHPHIRAAVRELRDANEELRSAAHDFCGHRAEAMRAIEGARRQLEFALECDRR